MWDKKKAVDYLDLHARKSSTGRCAQFVRKAIEAGGLKLHRVTSAKDYGQSLAMAGFGCTTVTDPKAGDVVVIQPVVGHPHGHIAMFDGKQWVSDFKQHHGYLPGPVYRRLDPSFVIYRYGR